jgi:uncharacterized iron-regulated membrane protein
MGQELVLHGWQLVWFALGNQGLMLAAIAFVMWMDKRAKRAVNTCQAVGCGCNRFEHGEIQ